MQPQLLCDTMFVVPHRSARRVLACARGAVQEVNWYKQLGSWFAMAMASLKVKVCM